MKWIALLFALAAPSAAQTNTTITNLGTWVQSQQANTGLGLDLHGNKDYGHRQRWDGRADLRAARRDRHRRRPDRTAVRPGVRADVQS